MQSTTLNSFLGIKFSAIPEKCQTWGSQAIDSAAKVFESMNESFKKTEMGAKINKVVSPLKIVGGTLATYALWNIVPLLGQALLIAATASLAMKLLFNVNVLNPSSDKTAQTSKEITIEERTHDQSPDGAVQETRQPTPTNS